MSDPASPAPPAGTSLRQKAAHGVMWGAALAVVSRFVGLIQQLALVWLLEKSDFGLMGLAYTVTAFVNLLANPGIDAVLIQRHRRFHLWATSAFWMGMATGVVGMAVTVVAAPIAAAIYGRPELTGLLLVMALAMPLQTLQIVPKAKLQSHLRFKKGVQFSFLGHISTALLTILFAALGFGAYSFVVPLPLTAAFLATVYWRAARPEVRFSPHFKRWKYLLGDSASLAGTRILLNLVGQGDYMILGLSRFPTSTIGVYVFAFGVAIQPYRLISGSLDTVLFPSLSQAALNRTQQVRAMLRAARLLAFFVAPICTLQILLAYPLFRLVVPPRWFAAVEPLQVLSISIMAGAPYWPSMHLMMAQRRFNELLRVSITNCIMFFAIVGSAVWLHRSIESAAIGVTVWTALSCPWAFWIAAGKDQSRLVYIREIYRPFLAAVGAAIPSAFIVYALSGTKWWDAAACLTTLVVFSVTYLFFMRTFAANDFYDFFLQASPLLKKLGIALPEKAATIANNDQH